MLRRTIRKVGSTNRYTDGSGRKLDTNYLPRDLYVQKISNRAYPQETEHWQVAEANTPSPFKGNVMISGAGVVGQTTAAMFALRGWHVTVVEQKPSPAERLEATAEKIAERTKDKAGSSSEQQQQQPFISDYDEIDCALLTRRGLDIFSAAGVPLEYLRHFGTKVEGVIEHPSGFNSLLTRNLSEEHPFAVNMLALDMARLREHLDTHLKRLPGANCKVFYGHQVVAAYPEKKKVVVKSHEEMAEERREREAWRQAYDAQEQAKQQQQQQSSSSSTTSSPSASSSDDPATSNPSATGANSSSTSAEDAPKALANIHSLQLNPATDDANYEGLSYDLLIDCEGASSRLRDMLNVEGFAADKIYGIKWFALDEVVEVDASEFTSQQRQGRDGEYVANPNLGGGRGDNAKSDASGSSSTFATADSMLEEDEYGRITQREKLRILVGDEERKKQSVRQGRRLSDMEAEEEAVKASARATMSKKGSGERAETDEEGKTARPDGEEEEVNQRYFYLEKSHIHRWTYPCPKNTPNTAVCLAFPRQRSVISTASSDESGASKTKKKFRNSYSVMAYFPMSVLRSLSDEEFLATYLSDLSFERKGFLRAPRSDEFTTEGGVSDGIPKKNNKGGDDSFNNSGRISYFELETPAAPISPVVAKYSTRGKITPFPTIYCEDLCNGIGLPSAVVVGDAAHCVNPFLMQNLAISLEDSSILLNQLDALSRHFYDSVKQYGRERGVAGDALRIVTERSLYYNRAKHVNPLVRMRNAYTKLMFRLMPAYYNEFYSTNMNHLYPRSVEWMLNGRGYTSYEKTEMTQTKMQRWYNFGRNFT